MLDLKTKQYDMETLRKHIYQVSLTEILMFQKIDEEFASQFILNPDYQLTPEEEEIKMYHVLCHQPHLDKMKLIIMQYTNPTKYKHLNFEVDSE